LGDINDKKAMLTKAHAYLAWPRVYKQIMATPENPEGEWLVVSVDIDLAIISSDLCYLDYKVASTLEELRILIDSFNGTTSRSERQLQRRLREEVLPRAEALVKVSHA
jgi:hypothetical protein